MDFIQQLQVFVTVVDTGSFARAAEALRMGRPSVTNAVSALEASVGARLLHRTTRRSSLTGEGELLYERATNILADVDETRDLFGGSARQPKGRLRIDIPVALAKPYIIPHLPNFMRQFPQIDIILGVSDQPVDLLAEGVDCVLRLGELSTSSMISRVVGRVCMVTCAAPSYLAAHGVPVSIDRLSEHRTVTYFSGRGRATLDWHFTQDAGVRVIKMRPAILVNETEALIASALVGLGMIQTLRGGVADHLSSGRFVEVLPDVKATSRPISIIYPNRQHLAPQVRAFIDWVTALLGQSVEI